MKNPNEPRLSKIKLTPIVKLGEKPIAITPAIDKKNPLIRLLKNEPPR